MAGEGGRPSEELSSEMIEGGDNLSVPSLPFSTVPPLSRLYCYGPQVRDTVSLSILAIPLPALRL